MTDIPTSAERIPTPLLPCPFCGGTVEPSVNNCVYHPMTNCTIAGLLFKEGPWNRRTLAQRAAEAVKCQHGLTDCAMCHDASGALFAPPPAAGGDDCPNCGGGNSANKPHALTTFRCWDCGCVWDESKRQARAARSDAGDALQAAIKTGLSYAQDAERLRAALEAIVANANNQHWVESNKVPTMRGIAERALASPRAGGE